MAASLLHDMAAATSSTRRTARVSADVMVAIGTSRMPVGAISITTSTTTLAETTGVGFMAATTAIRTAMDIPATGILRLGLEGLDTVALVTRTAALVTCGHSLDLAALDTWDMA